MSDKEYVKNREGVHLDVSKCSDLLTLAGGRAEEAAAALRRWSPHRKFASEELSEIVDLLNSATKDADELLREFERAASVGAQGDG